MKFANFVDRLALLWTALSGSSATYALASVIHGWPALDLFEVGAFGINAVALILWWPRIRKES